MITTPGYQFTTSEAVTAAKLNQAAVPAITFEQADKDTMVDEVKAKLGTGVAGPNYLKNPGLDLWTRGTSPVVCAPGIRQFRADDWWTRLQSTTALQPTYERVAASIANFLYAAKLVGNTGVGIVDFGQEIAARVAAALAGTVTLTFTLANGTGAALVPLIRLDTCDALEDYSAVTNRASVAAASVASGATATVTVQLDLSASGTQTALRNGALLYLRIPAGGLTGTIKNVTFSALKLELGSIATARVVERDLTDPARVQVNDRQFLFNGEFLPHLWITDNVTCLEDRENYAAAGWWATPSDGNTMRYILGDGGPANNLSNANAFLLGSIETTSTVDFGQNIPAEVAIHLQRQAVFSIWLRNDTGAAFSPLIRVETCSGEPNDFTVPALQDAQTLTSCAAGVWTQLTFALNGANYAGVSSGLRISLRIPAGVLNSAVKNVALAQAKLELGSVVTTFDPAPTLQFATVPAGIAADLLIQPVVGVPQSLFITASWASFGFSGALPNARDLATFVDATATGDSGLDTGTIANSTGYTIYLIAGRQGPAAILSLDPVRPLLPAGYITALRIGWARTDATGNFVSVQMGRQVRIASGAVVLATGLQTGSATVWNPYSTRTNTTLLALNTVLPPWARVWHGMASNTSGNDMTLGVAGLLTAGGLPIGEQSATLIPPAGATVNPTRGNRMANFRVPLLTTPFDFYLRGTPATATLQLELLGFDF